MTEAVETVTEAPTAHATRRKVKRAKPRRKAEVVKETIDRSEDAIFAGITMNDCCLGCREDRCVISTVAACKHPVKTGPSGCGPKTMANREKAMRIIKRQAIDKKV